MVRIVQNFATVRQLLTFVQSMVKEFVNQIGMVEIVLHIAKKTQQQHTCVKVTVTKRAYVIGMEKLVTYFVIRVQSVTHAMKKGG